MIETTDETLEESFITFRREVKEITERMKLFGSYLKDQGTSVPEGADKSEMIANFIISYRHLEDAAMRIGKVMQAMDGGVSVYDKK